jgi:pSer/pThr/pTyr-binding forkhead associated (FHA) protein
MELVIIVDGEPVRRLRLEREVAVTLGRGPDNSLTFDDGLVSRRHARIEYRDGWRIEDLDSRNGTRVNGQSVAAARLKEGDLVVIGHTRIRLVADGGHGETGPLSPEVVATPDGAPEALEPPVSQAAAEPGIEVVDGPAVGRSYPLDKPYVALGEAGAELAVVTREGAGHAVRGISGFGERLALNGVPLEENARSLSDGDRIQVGEQELIYRAR